MQISIFGFKVEIRKQTKLEEFRGYMAKAFGGRLRRSQAS